MISKNDLLIVSSLLPDQKKKGGYLETGAEHFLFNDLVQKNVKLRKYEQI